MNSTQNPTWLATPRTKLTKDPVTGAVRAAFVQFRDGVKAVRTEQPNPHCQVFFYIGADDLLVGIQLLEKVEGLAVQQILTQLLAAADGTPVGVTRKVTNHFVTLQEFANALNSLAAAADGLPHSQACCVH